MSTQPLGAIPITSRDEARGALGKVVQIRGTVRREKLGDTINLHDLSVRCPDFRFPDLAVGATVTVEGKLESTLDWPAMTSANGEISQGTDVARSSFVIRDCVVR